MPDSSPGPTTARSVVREGRVGAELLGERRGVGPLGEARGLGADQRVQVGEAEAGDVGVGRVGHHGDAVERDGQLDELDAGRLAGGGLLVLDLARGVADVGLTGAEALEAVAGAGTLDRVVEVRVRGLERLGDGGGDRLDGRRAGDVDRRPRRRRPRSRPGLAAMLSAALAAAVAAAVGAAALGAVVAPDPLLHAATSRAEASASPPRRFDVSSVTSVDPPCRWRRGAPIASDAVLDVSNGRSRSSTRSCPTC